MKKEIEAFPGVGNNTEINRRNRQAQAYIDSKAKRTTVRKEDLAIILCILFALIALVIGIIVKANFNEPMYQEGYYISTDVQQPNGNYFVYVTERICEVEAINNDLITVEYNGNFYDFFGYGYEEGQTIICQFTNSMEIVGVVE